MFRTTYPALLILCLASVALGEERPDILLADFEGDDYGEWQATGAAFGKAPARGTLPNQMPVAGYLGRGLVNSFRDGDGTQGTLTSPEFVVRRKRINFLLGGGHHPGRTCINLLAGGKVVRTATGPSKSPKDSEHLRWHSWDVSDLEGKKARLEIVDRATGGWGHINIDHIVLSDRPPPDEREALLAAAEESVRRAAAKVKDDQARPVYHVLAPGNWVNDPNGPIFYKGWYHLFYQHNPYGDQWGHMHWGHVRSKDMVRWEHLPVALWPSKEKGEDHVFSGCAAADAKGRLVLLYTSIGNNRPPEQWAAVAEDDEARRFRKYPGNPILTLKDHGGLKIDDWRDPFVFREGGRWYMAVGGHRAGGKGAVFLYDSDDLYRWRFLGVPFEGKEDNWECPNLFKLGGKWVLIYSPHGRVRYYTGELNFKAVKFTPAYHGSMDGDQFYAPNSMEDAKGRRILWGWVRGFKGGMGWNGCLTLPRVQTLRPDGSLGQEPLPELNGLGVGKPLPPDNVELADRAVPLLELVGDTMRLDADFKLGDAKEVGVRVRCSADGKRGAEVRFDGKTLHAAGESVPFTLPAGQKTLSLRVFIDRSVLEVYAEGRQCLTRVIDARPEDNRVEFFARGGTAAVRRLALPLGSIWSAAPAHKKGDNR